MLRNRSRAMTSKQALMPDQSFPSQNHTKPISSFFGLPNFLNGFLAKNPFETDTMSPTSILDTKPFFTVIINQPFGYDKRESKHKTPVILSGNKHPWEKLDPEGIGLALVASLIDEKFDKIPSQVPNSRMVLFGSKLNIQIPPIPPNAFSPTESPKSPADFGIKTRNSQTVNCLSPFGSLKKSSTQTKESPGFLSVREMMLSEDYTCVISHVPNPKTTIIYDDCILDSGIGFSGIKKQYSSLPEKSNFPQESFLSFCYTCKKNLELGTDIYMYRGEKAFCSSECRCQEMISDEVEHPEI